MDEARLSAELRRLRSQEWRDMATRREIGCSWDSLSNRAKVITDILLQTEAISEFLLMSRLHEIALPEQNRSALTLENLGILPGNRFFHTIRRAIAPITVVTVLEESLANHLLVNATDDLYSAGGPMEGKRGYYDGRFAYGALDTKGGALWRIGPDGKQYRCVNDIAPHSAAPRTARAYEVGSSLRQIQEWGMKRCIAFTVLFDEHKKVLAQHRLLFARFHELDLEPKPKIEKTLKDGTLTLKSDVFVWGVLLSFMGGSRLADNAFDLLPGIPYSLLWDEATLGKPRIYGTGNSLFQKP
jgi:hypothetical protein